MSAKQNGIGSRLHGYRPTQRAQRRDAKAQPEPAESRLLSTHGEPAVGQAAIHRANAVGGFQPDRPWDEWRTLTYPSG